MEVQRVWEVYDDRLQFMARSDALLLEESLRVGDVSQAWVVWSGAAEAALVDACRFAGGPVPVRGLVVGRGTAVVLLTFMRLVMSSCIVTLFLLFCLIFVGGIRRLWISWIL